MLSRLSIRLRLLLLVAVPLSALLVVGVAALASINATSASSAEAALHVTRQSQLLALTERVRAMVAPLAAPASASAHATLRDQLREQRALVQQEFDAYADALAAPARSRFRDTAGPALAAVLQLVADADAALGTVDAAPMNAVHASDPLARAQPLTYALADAAAREGELADRIATASVERARGFVGVNAGLSIGGLALALMFGFYIARSITAPVGEISATVERVAAGDLTRRTRPTGYDEIAALGRALDRLLDEKVNALAAAERENTALNDSVIALLRAVSRLSQRDLTVRVPISEDVTGPVADAINQLAEETSKVLLDVSRIADLVAVASTQVNDKALGVNSSATAQHGEVLETVAQLAAAATRLAEISELAQRCNELARRTTETTDTAVRTVNGTLLGMNDIREVIQETGKRIKRLGERSQEISGIVDIINRLAERTTVLALNASMQAAAAGDAGRGFGVVADEVQRLAENSRNATAQIAALVKNIQIETSDTIGAMDTAIGHVVEGSRLAESAGRQIVETQGTTTTLVHAVAQIAASSHEQAQLSASLRDRAQTILLRTRATGIEVTEQLKQTGHLAEFSRDLLESVRVFKLPA
jgi:methyl-accepting chemotaxis protein